MPALLEEATMFPSAMANLAAYSASTVTLRKAVPDDAADLVDLVNSAGEGLPMTFWRSLAPDGIDPRLVGEQRIRREESVFSYRKAEMALAGGRVAGAIIDYALHDAPEPVTAETPSLFRPLNELENLACGSWYVNILAVKPAWRRRGIGRILLKAAESRAQQAGRSELSIIVSDGNVPAQRLYADFGFKERASRAMAEGNWHNSGVTWRLLVKKLQD
jgi:ribosomal protein S18 acetylase RimI-like enzyme